MKDKESTTECAGFAHSDENGIEKKAALRLSALARNPRRLREIDEAFPLLAAIVTACGEKDDCVVNLHDTANSIGVSHTTIRQWLGKLSKLEYVGKSFRGKLGVKLWLKADIFDVESADGNDSTSVPDEVIEGVRALRLTINHAFDSFLNINPNKDAA